MRLLQHCLQKRPSRFLKEELEELELPSSGVHQLPSRRRSSRLFQIEEDYTKATGIVCWKNGPKPASAAQRLNPPTQDQRPTIPYNLKKPTVDVAEQARSYRFVTTHPEGRGSRFTSPRWTDCRLAQGQAEEAPRRAPLSSDAGHAHRATQLDAHACMARVPLPVWSRTRGPGLTDVSPITVRKLRASPSARLLTCSTVPAFHRQRLEPGGPGPLPDPRRPAHGKPADRTMRERPLALGPRPASSRPRPDRRPCPALSTSRSTRKPPGTDPFAQEPNPADGHFVENRTDRPVRLQGPVTLSCQTSMRGERAGRRAGKARRPHALVL